MFSTHPVVVDGMFNELKSHFQWLEQSLGVEGATFVRWLLFMPAGLVSGIALSAWFSFLVTFSNDSDIELWGFVISGFCGGFCSVLVGQTIAPRYPRIVAVIMASVIVALTIVFVCWVKAKHDSGFVLPAEIAGGVYSLGAVMTSVIFVRHHKN